MKKPLVSIITVVFNGERYISKTIESVSAQDYPNFEYVIIDGASTDNTLQIINQYKDQISTVISEKDEGLSDAMNKGLTFTKGDWILYLHADDTFASTSSISDLISAVEQDSNIFWLTGYLNFQDANDEIFRRDNFYKINWYGMIARNVIRHQATLVQREAILNVKFRKEFKYAMDYDFFLRLWMNYGKPKIVKKHIVNFRLDGNNLSSNYYASMRDEMNARFHFRKENSQYIYLVLDWIIYCLRYLKLKFIHRK